jgi:hypothetical protein
LNNGGNDIFQQVGQGGQVTWGINTNGGIQVPAQPLAATGSINGRIPALYVITAGSAATITVTAPTATVDDGLEIEVAPNTNFAQVIAVGAGKLLGATTGGPFVQVTMPAFAGAVVFLTPGQVVHVHRWRRYLHANIKSKPISLSGAASRRSLFHFDFAERRRKPKDVKERFTK